MRNDQSKARRLAFAQGYADAWARRDERRRGGSDDAEAYREGYTEGEEDRARADHPSRQPPKRQKT